MPRRARVVIPGEPHHVVQRGNRRQRTFFSQHDYRLYLRLAAEACREHGVEVWAYCLMPNHVHLIAVPGTPDALAKAIGIMHQKYAQAVNQREGWTGYLWQGRFSSFPMDEAHLLNCVRYVGLNPVRAGLASRAVDWPWSSVPAHARDMPDILLTRSPVVERAPEAIADLLERDVDDEALESFRGAALTGRPLGAEAWVRSLEEATGRQLRPRPIGRPRTRKASSEDLQRFRALLAEGAASPLVGPADFEALHRRLRERRGGA